MSFILRRFSLKQTNKKIKGKTFVTKNIRIYFSVILNLYHDLNT